MANCKEVFFTGWYSYSIFKANRLSIITATFPIVDYYFINPFKGSDNKCCKLSDSCA